MAKQIIAVLIGIIFIIVGSSCVPNDGAKPSNPVVGFDTIYNDVDIILVLVAQNPPPPPKDKQIRFCLYGGKMTITCGKQVDMDKASKVFFGEVLKPMVDMYIQEELHGPSMQIKGK